MPSSGAATAVRCRSLSCAPGSHTQLRSRDNVKFELIHRGEANPVTAFWKLSPGSQQHHLKVKGGCTWRLPRTGREYCFNFCFRSLSFSRLIASLGGTCRELFAEADGPSWAVLPVLVPPAGALLNVPLAAAPICRHLQWCTRTSSELLG